MAPDVINGNSNLAVPDAPMWLFGAMTSTMHMAWVRAVCGRLKSDFRYSAQIVYNNFPWPSACTNERTNVDYVLRKSSARTSKPPHKPCSMPAPRMLAQRSHSFMIH
jgi:hypothetical protein